MRKLGLILAVCLAFSGTIGAHADVGDTVRAAVRRATASGNVQQNRQRPENTNSTSTLRPGNDGTTQNVRGRGTANVTTRTNTNIVERKSSSPGTRTTTANVVQRTPSYSVLSRNAPNVAPATTTSSLKNTNTPTRAIARAASNTVTREDILSRDYSKCKKVFSDCMDEFCANKDAQLKRCACSSRINEFDSVKRRLDAAEEKMLDFSQRLLTVSMEKEDAEALHVASEGEEAYYAGKDTSASKRTLDAIAKKLKTSFNTSAFDNNSNVLSWSLDIDSAFDSVDSLRGAATTAKSGTALYAAALPICREMAAEVCAQSDISLAEGGYLALIEQDCNTVAQTYQDQVDQARTRVQEGSALLDMSRLDIYQQRNSDDILTCKKKMLDMLTNSTVCGTNLEKCLDVSGQYIDPSTGETFLDPKLVQLSELLTRPDGDERWSTVQGNAQFVSYLNSKRKFLDPATEQCQDIADIVWDSFIDDALSQIKLAQDKKLETVRQSCTTLVSQCMSDANESITNFDARALSTFGIKADATVNAMCQDVLETCNALLRDGSTTQSDWEKGVAGIQIQNSYDTLLNTCRQVGRACIIQVCSSVSGNFGLCESIANSTNRKTIINHTACWDEVNDCIRSAGEETINKIYAKFDLPTTSDAFYTKLYDGPITEANPTNASACTAKNTENCVYSMCSSECGANDQSSTSYNCRVCRLAESLWGNCESLPTQTLGTNNHNKIRKQKSDVDDDTLLYWFAKNTGTDNADDSCRDTTCGIGYIPYIENDVISCGLLTDMCFESYSYDTQTKCSSSIKPTSNNRCQCCSAMDKFGHCCESKSFTYINGDPYCVPDSTTTVVVAKGSRYILLCNGTMGTNSANQPYCDGTLIVVDTLTKHYITPTNPNFVTETFMYGTTEDMTGVQCTYNGSAWKQTGLNSNCTVTKPINWSVVYNSQP